jgi:hypothetical protein
MATVSKRFLPNARQLPCSAPSPSISAFTRVFAALCGGGVGSGWTRENPRVGPLPVPPPQAGEGTLCPEPSLKLERERH